MRPNHMLDSPKMQDKRMSYAISGFFSVALLGIIGQVELSTGHIEGVFAYILAGALGMTAIVGYRENLPRKSL